MTSLNARAAIPAMAHFSVAMTSKGTTMTVRKESQDSNKILEKNCPLSTDSERQRFLKLCNGDREKATQRLRKYLDWRALHAKALGRGGKEEETEKDDKAEWENAYHAALDSLHLDGTQKRRRTKHRNAQTAICIPQIIMLHQDKETGDPVMERDGRLLFHVLPAQIDKKLTSSGIYELTIALYLESKFDRDSLCQGTLLLDVRPGVGFPNAPALMLMPFIQSITKYLNQRFPERLYRCILFPLPRPALWLWHMASALIDDSVVERIKLIAGSEAIDAPPPNEDLAEYIDESILEQCESARLAAFVRS